MSADKLIDRLDRPRKTGGGRWIARCPAHDDRSPSLSVREVDDGRVLIHCFGGCEPGDVLAAVGLEFSDLFPRVLGDFAPIRTRIPAGELLALLDHEMAVIALIAADTADQLWLEDHQIERIQLAASRIGQARDSVRG